MERHVVWNDVEFIHSRWRDCAGEIQLSFILFIYSLVVVGGGCVWKAKPLEPSLLRVFLFSKLVVMISFSLFFLLLVDFMFNFLQCNLSNEVTVRLFGILSKQLDMHSHLIFAHQKRGRDSSEPLLDPEYCTVRKKLSHKNNFVCFFFFWWGVDKHREIFF